MITCPVCAHQEYEGALFCTECGARLLPSSRVFTRAIANDTGSYPSSPPPEQSDSLPGVSVKLFLMDYHKIIPLLQGETVVLGRVAEGESQQPDVDLSAFGAYRAGVSRRHALLHLQEGALTITDLKSSNGTRVNGKRIAPHQPVLLQHGDVVALGKLRIQVLFEKGA